MMMLTSISYLGAQEKQRIAVIPFNPVNIAKDEAEIIYTDFESALVETDAYVVIDRDEVIRLLGDGETSLFSCTNEQCALDIGSRLAGGQVVRGTIFKTSDGYTLTIQVLDVSNGRVIFLDEISERFLSDMRDSMELLAFKLGGLITIRNNKPVIAREFTQLFIETIPSRADIFINGTKKGVSPDIISRVPVGRIKISARYGNFYGTKVLDVTENTGQVQIECREAYGGLTIRTEDDLDVYLDDRWLGKVNSGLFSNLTIGIHTLELKSQELYWRDEVVIRGNERTFVKAQVKEYGRIEYGIPEGASAEIKGEMFREVVRGYGTLPVPAEKYSITVSGKNYENHDQITVSVVRGATVSLLPNLQYTKEYEYELFTERIEEAERSIEFGYRLTNRDLRGLRDLNQNIEQSKHDFFELVPRVNSLIEQAERIIGGVPLSDSGTQEEREEKQKQLNALLAQKQGLELELASIQQIKRRRAVGGWTTFGVGVLAGGLTGLFYYLGNEAYKTYLKSSTPDEFRKNEKISKLWDISTLAAMGTSGVCLVVASVCWITSPSTKHLSEELDSIEQKINILQDELQ